MGLKGITGRRWVKFTTNLILWILFIVFAFGYALGGLIAIRLPRKQAIPVYRLALKIYPWGGLTRHELGVALLTTGDVEGGIVELRKAVQAEPNVVRFRTSLGFALLQKGDIDDAIQEFEEAVRLDPHYDELRRNLQQAISAREKKEREKADLETHHKFQKFSQ